MPYMIRMSVERLNCVTLRLSNTFVYLRFETSQSRRLLLQSVEKIKALKELAKETPHKDVTSLFGVPKNNLSTWKNNKDKIFEKYKAALFQKE